MFAIEAIEIERSDGRSYCGILEYASWRQRGTLLWTVEWRDTPEVLVEFFPGDAFEDAETLREHQALLISGVLDTLSERMGQETLFTT